MLEREASGFNPKVMVDFNSLQDTPFAVKKDSKGWQLSVNRFHFEAMWVPCFITTIPVINC